MDVLKYVLDTEKELKQEFEKIDEISFYNSKKVLDAFKKYNLSEKDFVSSTGYGYGDIGREKIEKIYSEIFNV